MRIASGNRMCSVAAYKCSTSLSCKSLYCSLHMNTFVDVFVFYMYLGKNSICINAENSDYFLCD